MATMVQEPYVNHVPTIVGGIGSKDLYRFYRDFFIPGNPPSLKVRETDPNKGPVSSFCAFFSFMLLVFTT